MQQTDITFTFTGDYADQHVLDGSDAVHYTEAARQLLGLHAYFYTMGTVPKRGVLNQTDHYRVFKRAPEAACYVDPWVVGIVSGTVSGIFAVYGVRAIDYGFARFFKDSVDPIIRGKPSWAPPEMQGETVLQPQDARNAPFLDAEAERTYRWGQLRERATIVMPNVARPVGRSASKLAITSDSMVIGEIEYSVLRRLMGDAQAYKEAAITDALQQLGVRQ